MVEHGRGHVAVAQNILLLLLYNKLAAQNVQLALKRSPVCDGVRRVGDKRQLFQNGRRISLDRFASSSLPLALLCASIS